MRTTIFVIGIDITSNIAADIISIVVIIIAMISLSRC